MPAGFETFRQWYAEWGVWVILIKGATPIPYKLVTIASGLAAFNFPVFVVASIVTRGVRFFLVAFVLKRYGPAILALVERRLYPRRRLRGARRRRIPGAPLSLGEAGLAMPLSRPSLDERSRPRRAL